MQEKLSESLDEALRIIANQEQTLIPFEDIRQLLAIGYIRHASQGGWIVNELGCEYLICFVK